MSVEKLLRELGVLGATDDLAALSDPLRGHVTPCTPFDAVHACFSFSTNSIDPPFSPADLLKGLACRVEALPEQHGTFRLHVRITQSRIVVVERTLRDVHTLLRDLEEESPFLCLPTAAAITTMTSADESHLEWLFPFTASHGADITVHSPALLGFFFATEKPYVKRPPSVPPLHKCHAPEFAGSQGSGWGFGRQAETPPVAPALTAEGDVMIGLAGIDPSGLLGALYLAVCGQAFSITAAQTLFDTLRAQAHELRMTTLHAIPALAAAHGDDLFAIPPLSGSPRGPHDDDVTHEMSLLVVRRLRILRHLTHSLHQFFHRVVDVTREQTSAAAALIHETQRRRAAGVVSAPPADALDRSAARVGRWNELQWECVHRVVPEVCRVRAEIQAHLLVAAKLLLEMQASTTAAVSAKAAAALETMPVVPYPYILLGGRKPDSPPPPPPPKKAPSPIAAQDTPTLSVASLLAPTPASPLSRKKSFTLETVRYADPNAGRSPRTSPARTMSAGPTSPSVEAFLGIPSAGTQERTKSAGPTTVLPSVIIDIPAAAVLKIDPTWNDIDAFFGEPTVRGQRGGSPVPPTAGVHVATQPAAKVAGPTTSQPLASTSRQVDPRDYFSAPKADVVVVVAVDGPSGGPKRGVTTSPGNAIDAFFGVSPAPTAVGIQVQNQMAAKAAGPTTSPALANAPRQVDPRDYFSDIVVVAVDGPSGGPRPRTTSFPAHDHAPGNAMGVDDPSGGPRLPAQPPLNPFDGSSTRSVGDDRKWSGGDEWFSKKK